MGGAQIEPGPQFGLADLPFEELGTRGDIEIRFAQRLRILALPRGLVQCLIEADVRIARALVECAGEADERVTAVIEVVFQDKAAEPVRWWRFEATGVTVDIDVIV